LGQKNAALHSLHADVPFLTNPLVTQVQLSMCVDPATEVENSGQALFVASPGQKNPAAHATHLVLLAIA